MNWLKSAFAVTIVLFLSACHQSGRSSNTVTTTNTPNAPEPSSSKSDGGGGVSRSGPSDGGGGDTCNGKMIESYKVNINELPEFKDFVIPIFKKIGEGNAVSSLFMAPYLKTWYIIDCKLQDLPKDRKGLYLETYQTAIHTQREIFIEAASYNAMEKSEKGKLLLHEIVMALYLLKYTSFKDMCRALNNCQGDIGLIDKWKMFRPIPYRPLDKSDHQRIRFVTAWLINTKIEDLSIEKFKDILKNNDFDRRIEYMQNSGGSETEQSKKVEIEIDTFVKMLKRYQYTQKFPEYCQFDPVTGLSRSKCKTDVIVSVDEKVVTVTMKIVRVSDKAILNYDFKMPIDSSHKKITLYVSRFPTEQGPVLHFAPMVLMANWPMMDLTIAPVKEGDRSQMLYLMLDVNDLKSPEIYQIVIQNLVWFSFDQEVKTENNYTTTITYGYAALLEKESESLFVEKEQPYDTFKMLIPSSSRQMVGFKSLYTPSSSAVTPKDTPSSSVLPTVPVQNSNQLTTP